jgi:hypothetical protein
MSSRIKIGFAKDEPTPASVFHDLAWVSDNRLDLYQKYGRCYVLVYQEEIIGTGKTIDEAIQDADSRLSPEIELITPAIGSVFNPHESYFHIKALMRQHFERKRQNNSSE